MLRNIIVYTFFSIFFFSCSNWELPEKQPKPTLIEMINIAGGSFLRGSNSGDTDESPVKTIRVSAFSMGKYEITVSQFSKFIEETNYRTDAEKEGGSVSTYNQNASDYKSGVNWRHEASGNGRLLAAQNHPVLNVSHSDALAFCVWLSNKEGKIYRLPTEAEWEYAARNGSSATEYSWGNGSPFEAVGNVADETANRTFGFDRSNTNMFLGYNDNYAYTAPVGSFKPNRFGLYDMTGNVWEWCSDWYFGSYYSSVSDNQLNPTGPSSGVRKVIKGGSFINNPYTLRASFRGVTDDTNRGNNLVGFRVVTSPI